MAWLPDAVRRAAIVLLVGTTVGASLSAQAASSGSGLTRIALFEPSGKSSDPALAAALHTVADSIELSLVVLQRYDVRRLAAANPDTDLARVRSYCDANHIDQAILGSAAERSGGGFDFRLLVYDRKSDSITIDRKGSSSGALDMFDTTDTLVSALLDGLSGTHVLFGSLTVDTDPPGAAVALNGRDAGPAPLSLRGLPVGRLQVSARASGHEDATATVTIADGEAASASLKLARSTGTLNVQAPADAQVTVASAELGQKQLSGPGSLDLPTGDYQVQAASPGLAAVTGTVTVSRNAATSWLPWSKGYLVVQAVPAGAVVTVDGVARGAVPQVIEVEPWVLHRLQVAKDKYETYVADASAEAGEKVPLSVELAGLPGSIKVETSMPGARVHVDDGEWQDTPFVFKDIPAGTHTVAIQDLRSGEATFTAGPPLQVTVSPGEETDVTREMVRGRSHLTITAAPPGSVVEVAGQPVDSAQALSDGVDVPSGIAHLAVAGPSSQRWTGNIYLQPGANVHTSIYDLTWTLPRRSIALDGGAEQWSGLVKEWNRGIYGSFVPGQPGTFISGGYASVDDRFLYVRFEFGDGSPTTKLVPQIKRVLSYGVLIYTNHNQADRVTIGIRISRQQSGPSGNFGVWNENTKRWTDLDGTRIAYHLGQDSLQVQIPLASIRDYLKGLSLITLQEDEEDYAGQWGHWIETPSCRVAFGF